jgi:predicted Zn-dependent protease
MLHKDWRLEMASDTPEFDELQNAYKAAVENWIAAIREEEALVSVTPHSVAEVDKWEAAHFKEEEVRCEVKAAKKAYEDALREKFFGF